MPRFSLLLLLAAALPCLGERVTLSLDGEWEIADSLAAEPAPTAYTHKAPVPGLAHSSTPAFADVDLFDSRELIVNRVSRGDLPRSALITTVGVPRQNRTYFWYRTRFTPQARRVVAILRVNKAQFGTAVWLNGKKIGEHFGCFTAGIFDATAAMRWDGANELVIRVGAHPGALPPNVSGGTDFEKNRWTPGIYDSVSLALSDNPVIETIQVAPRIASSEIAVQTVLHNYGPAASVSLKHAVKPWKDARTVAELARTVKLAAGETQIITQSLKIANVKLWTPEEPNLYVLETSTGGDSTSTRFGMREFRFDTPTRRAYLNGKPYFMRGSNITLHRFFEDPVSGTLPWNEQWVRKLLIDIPKKMSWNSFRFCIGPVPDRWLDIADEAGLLIQNEYFIWIGHNWHAENNYHPTFDADQLISEYREWMRDNWNHPSVAIWDANNETWYEDFATKIIPAVRGLDLSNRPWENSYYGPVGPDDPVEDHPYEHAEMAGGGPEFTMADLENRSGRPGHTDPPTGHALILNEYGWLWLNRDGTPTRLTRDLYSRLLGENATADQRREINAYLLGGLTEFWRVHRNYAGVLHFVYLAMSDPMGYTCDHFRDVPKLELDPYFADYMSEAFKPLGAYISFFQPKLAPGSSREYTVMLVNDDSGPVRGNLTLAWENARGEIVGRESVPFSLAGLGQQTLWVNLAAPAAPGQYLLKGTAMPEGTRHHGPTISRRKVEIR